MAVIEQPLFEQEPKVKLNAYEVIARLEKKYAPPSWGFFTEVKSSVGFGNRRADGIAVAMWRSLGLEIHGFEVKVSRADWLNELKDGGKSDEIFKYCNRWWVVVGDPSIVRHGELPPTWGLQVPHRGTFKVLTKAPKLTPEPLTPAFVAEILRRHFDSMKRPEQLQAEYQRGFEAGKEKATPFELKWEVEKAQKLQKSVEEFEKASGVKIRDWNAGDIGAAVLAILSFGPEKAIEQLSWTRDEVARILKDVEGTILRLNGALAINAARTEVREKRAAGAQET